MKNSKDTIWDRTSDLRFVAPLCHRGHPATQQALNKIPVGAKSLHVAGLISQEYLAYPTFRRRIFYKAFLSTHYAECLTP